jgi:hypothetical protein
MPTRFRSPQRSMNRNRAPICSRSMTRWKLYLKLIPNEAGLSELRFFGGLTYRRNRAGDAGFDSDD